MSHRHVYVLEKFQIQLATAAAVAVVYVLAWPVVCPLDPQGPLTFLPTGNLAGLAALAGIVLLLAAAAAVLTAYARPAGALVVAFLGASGVSLRSPSIRTLLWRADQHMPGVYAQLLAEMAILGLLLAAAAAVVFGLRWLIGAINPRWLWPDPAARAGFCHEGPQGKAPAGKGATAAKAAGTAQRSVLLQAVLCFVAGAAFAAVLLLALLRSGDRGQVLFAVFAGSLLAVLLAQQLFPSRYSVTAWAMPVVVAMGFYVLAALTAGTSEQAWMRVPHYGNILPVDWLTAGVGGAAGGFWVAARLREVRHLEEQTERG